MVVKGFGVTARSTVDTRKLDPTAIIVFHQAYVFILEEQKLLTDAFLKVMLANICAMRCVSLVYSSDDSQLIEWFRTRYFNLYLLSFFS
jgi:hypothetical protein